MRPRAILGTLAACAVAIAAATHARADTPPNLWDEPRHPGAMVEYAVHVTASQMLFRVYEAQHAPLLLTPEQAQVWKAQRIRMLEQVRELLSGAQNASDPYVRYDRAWLAMETVSPQEEYPLPLARASLLEALAILEPLSKELGQTQLASNVWQRLAECYVRLERPLDEIHAYDQELALATEDGERVTPLLNQGEAYMRTGQIDSAVQQFREVLRLSSLLPYGNEHGILAQWDIAVGLDRSGDARGGLEAARVALHMDSRFRLRGLFPISVFNANVYFVPEYEREWYLGLGEAALALDETTASAAANDLQNAEEHMKAYVERAKPDDRWLDLAKKRLADVHARRADADKRASKEKTPKAADVDF